MMGWAHCGTDSKGREIGYAIKATCDEPGCAAEIDRGLAYKCGKMHGDGIYWCEGYFCEKHLYSTELPDGEWASLCARCLAALDAEHPECEQCGARPERLQETEDGLSLCTECYKASPIVGDESAPAPTGGGQ